jgi:hypothetical protein
MQRHSTFSFKWNLNYTKSDQFFFQSIVVHSSKEPNLNDSVMPINSLFELLDTKNEVETTEFCFKILPDCQMRSFFITQKEKEKWRRSFPDTQRWHRPYTHNQNPTQKIQLT